MNIKELIYDFEKRGKKEMSTVIGTKTKIRPITVPSATEMIAELLSDHETCARTARWALSVARAVDAPTEDLLIQRVMAHEKAAWMLRSMLAEERPLSNG